MPIYSIEYFNLLGLARCYQLIMVRRAPISNYVIHHSHNFNVLSFRIELIDEKRTSSKLFFFLQMPLHPHIIKLKASLFPCVLFLFTKCAWQEMHCGDKGQSGYLN